VDFKKALNLFNALSRAAGSGLARSIHDCSEGGLGVALAEMAFAGGLGMDVFLSNVPYEGKRQKAKGKSARKKSKAKEARNEVILFSESNSRFVVEVEKKKQREFEKAMKGQPVGLIGCVSAKKELKIFGLDGKICIKANTDKLKETWRAPLKW
jgi:phosphoribosylformylglycinamidine synthase